MESSADILAGMILELRRGTIILTVLCKLAKPMYGYNLVQELSESGIPVEANTLYPLLRRLEKQGLLESRWETAGAKPRKYYVTSDRGKEIYVQLCRHWNTTVADVNQLLAQEESNHG